MKYFFHGIAARQRFVFVFVLFFRLFVVFFLREGCMVKPLTAPNKGELKP